MNLADKVFAALVDWPKCALCQRAYRPRHKRHSMTVGLPWRITLSRGTSKTFPQLCLCCNRTFVPCGVCNERTLARHMWKIELPVSGQPKYFCQSCSDIVWKLAGTDRIVNQPLPYGGKQLGRF